MFDYEEYLPKIIKTHAYVWGEDAVPVRINSGFTNVVFDMGKAILKICADPKNEPNFQREGEFLLFHGSVYHFAPHLYSFSSTRVTAPFYYEVLEKIGGASLYSQWAELGKRERRGVVDGIADIIESLHNMRGSKVDWCARCRDRISSAFDKCRESFSDAEAELIYKAMEQCEKYLGHEERTVFVHNDMHFDNIFYDRGLLKLIDYERSCYAPEDFELDIILRMLREPKKYASEADEGKVNPDDYADIRKRLEKHCKSLFAVSGLEKRLQIYDLAYQLELFAKFPENRELHGAVIDAANALYF